ncbi:GLIPR1-like protein 1 [Salarias fasciatus]|uniref:SCP domain-containing protein n=1 Tax=Salarias fasciatus TaxID=181472 RepID=A0A672IW30_SALFA|nr:glioma pathogenesis-related protein 1 [Salarias fasciatus]
MSVSPGLVLLLGAWTVQLDPGVCSLRLPDISDRRFVEECVRQHNAARSSVDPAASDMLYMSWDEALAITARAWSRRCEWEHNPRRSHPDFRSVGENLWAGSSPSSFSVKKAIELWVNESQDYSFQRNDCRGVCGHYTQVAWASSYKVGCAVQSCPNGVKGVPWKEGVIFVCNYAPAGNVNGGRPYQTGGAPCSRCDGYCADKLCRSKERDVEKRYSRTPDGDSAPTSGYVSIVTVRPIALVLTFAAAFAVRYFYPDVFCYE